MTRTAKPYAYRTKVDVVSSRNEIERLLAKHGAAQILTAWDRDRHTGVVGFTKDGRQYRLPVPARQDDSRDAAQLERERWRVLVLWLKAKLEMIANGASSMETEFLAHTVLPDGSTVADTLAPQLEEAYATGRMPRLLPEGI